MPWSWFEFAKCKFAKDRDAVRPVQCDGTDVKNTSNGSVGTGTNQVDSNTEENRDPDCIEWGSCETIDLSPDVGGWNEAVTGESKDGSP